SRCWACSPCRTWPTWSASGRACWPMPPELDAGGNGDRGDQDWRNRDGRDRDPPAPAPPPPTPARLPPIPIRPHVVAVERLSRLLSRQPGLRQRVFTERELSYCDSRPRRCAEHLAARFAAKEAVVKALGTGIGTRMRWTDVEVVNALGGRPVVRLYG